MVRFVSRGLAAVVVCAFAGSAWGQASSSSSSDSNTVSDVVVEAVRPGVVRRIDRTTYDVKDDPQAKAASLVDILGKLPSVSVGADGKVRLLGSGNVVVQFDGKTTQGTDVKLNSLTGADVERIEVMTNPSAQASAQGTGGIINIISRRPKSPGWTGQIGVTAGSEGFEARVSPSLTRGKWTFGGMANASRRHYISRRWQTRDYLDSSGGVLGTRAGTSRDRQDNDVQQGQLKLTYRPTDKQTLTVSASGFEYDSDSRNRREVRSAYAPIPSYVENRNGEARLRDRNFYASYERQGPREGETLKLDAFYDRGAWTTASTFLDTGSGGDQRFVTRGAALDQDTTLSLDYERPFGGKTLLTAGGSWIRNDHRSDDALDNFSGPPTLGPSYARRLTSHRETSAAYATFQFPVLGWTVLPGLRYEDMTLDLVVVGATPSIHDSNLFPSLHVSRKLPHDLSLKLSYSRRIQRPEPDSLDPNLQYGGSESAWSGNPNLKPTFTDAYEAKLSRTIKGASVDLTVYDRQSRGEVDRTRRLTPRGTLISMPVNAGIVTRRGGEASVRGALFPESLGGRLKYVVTADVYQRDGELFGDGVLRRQHELSYDGSLQLDYKTAAATGAEAQQFQVSLRASGPTDNLQSHAASWFLADFTWRRPVTRKVSGVLTVTDLLKTQKLRNREWGAGYRDVLEGRNSAPRVRLAMTYQLGGKP